MDLISEAYGTEVGDALRSGPPEMSCECCGNSENLRGVPLIMAKHEDGGRAANGSQGPPQRAICSPCFVIWYEYGLTDQEAIGRKHRELKAAGKYPFRKQE